MSAPIWNHGWVPVYSCPLLVVDARMVLLLLLNCALCLWLVWLCSHGQTLCSEVPEKPELDIPCSSTGILVWACSVASGEHSASSDTHQWYSPLTRWYSSSRRMVLCASRSLQSAHSWPGTQWVYIVCSLHEGAHSVWPHDPLMSSTPYAHITRTSSCSHDLCYLNTILLCILILIGC